MGIPLLQAAPTIPLSWPTVIVAIAGGTAASALITFLANRNLKAKDFTYDYRKYMLEKRKDVYNDIEKMLQGINRVHNYDRPGRRVHRFVMAESENPILDFHHEILNIGGKEFWLSKEMRDYLYDLSLIVLQMEREFGFQNRQKTSIPEIAKRHFEKITLLAGKINTVYFKDLMTLDDFKTFKKEKFL